MGTCKSVVGEKHFIDGKRTVRGDVQVGCALRVLYFNYESGRVCREFYTSNANWHTAAALQRLSPLVRDRVLRVLELQFEQLLRAVQWRVNWRAP